MMKKDTNTMTLNLEVKSNLAKLLANENITIQHNKVKTASFDVKNRVLTLPLFKQKSGDVYDMLIAHECAHALWTPYEEWQGIDNDELRSYVNVLEDCRIDLLIQAKYPGVVTNYKNGFDILEKQNFFGISGRDINKEFMIIDKINLRSKSLQRLPFIFTPKDNEWLAKVDALVTFDDVLTLAKEMLGAIREKYNTVPIPGSEVSLDGAALRAEAQTEKDSLIEQLRENLNEVSKKQRMENEASMVEQQQQIMNRVPIAIYVG